MSAILTTARDGHLRRNLDQALARPLAQKKERNQLRDYITTGKRYFHNDTFAAFFFLL